MPEKVIIENCSPTLAGIKPASLVTLKYDNKKQAREDIRYMNAHLFISKGLRAVPLQYGENRLLLFLYRPGYLKRRLEDKEIRSYLENLGYCCDTVEKCVARLACRLQSCPDFPHEIGVFLGYPLADVVGFTEHRDVGCKCTGYWKVYDDEDFAHDTFERYRNCTACYMRSWLCGASLESLTVRL